MIKQLDHYLIYIVILSAGLLTAAAYFLPIPNDSINETADRWHMVLTIAMVTSIVGGALLFLQGLSAFKTGLRVSYRWLAFGIMLLAAGLMQWPFLVLYEAQSSLWVLSGAASLPFVISAVFVYKGLRQFAKLLQIDSRITSWLVAFVSVLTFSVLSGMVSYTFLTTVGPPDINDDTYLYTMTIAWSAGFGLLAWLLTIKVHRAIGASYKMPMNWLVAALGTLCFGAFHEYVASFLISDNDWYFYTGLMSWPFILTGVLFIIAGYKFNDRRITTPINPATEDSIRLDQSYVESVTHIAQLASHPTAIEPILGGLRQSAATVQDGGSLTDEDRIQLLDTYKQLEDYLLVSDPLKSFTKEQLRMTLPPLFRSKVNSIF